MIEITNLTSDKIDEERLKKVAAAVFKGETGKADFPLSVALVGEDKMRELNKKYLKKDYSTDVLSFQGQEDFKGVYGSAGEVVICPSQVRKNAVETDSDFETELLRVLVHGILHILGYQHEESEEEAAKMEKREQGYLEGYLEK
jgi:probable rRNA maturation factor